MPGDDWRRHATLRALYGYMFAHPGKKLLFMGGEIAQRREWNHDSELEWALLDEPRHLGMQQWVRDLNHHYLNNPSLWQRDYDAEGFSWIDCHDFENSILSFVRRGLAPDAVTVIVVNFTPTARYGYRIGVPKAKAYTERLNSDAEVYGGSNVGNQGRVAVEAHPSHGFTHSIQLTIPPLALVLLEPETAGPDDTVEEVAAARLEISPEAPVETASLETAALETPAVDAPPAKSPDSSEPTAR
jgi:1,4-alpha-glucan branching enzyme